VKISQKGLEATFWLTLYTVGQKTDHI